MSDPTPPVLFDGSIPQLYDQYLGPTLFEPYARDLASRLPATPGLRVLETACGTGIVTRRLLEALPADGTLTATDLNAPMLDYARTRVPADSRLTWKVADAQDLPFERASFDVLVCQFGVMFFPEKPRGLAEARRVLAPGGRLFYSTWDRLEINHFTMIAHEVVTAAFPEDPPQFYRMPFSMHDTAALRALTAGAGFRDVSIEALEMTLEAESARALATGLVRGNPMANELAGRGGDMDALVGAVATRLAAEYGDRPLRCPSRTWMVTATA